MHWQFPYKNNATSRRVHFQSMTIKINEFILKPWLKFPSLLANPDTDRSGKSTLECDPHAEKPVGVIVNKINNRKRKALPIIVY